MSDWLGDLSPKEQADWDDFVARTRRDLVPKIKGSALTLSLTPSSGKADVKFALELGMSIMLGKPIVAVAMAGQVVPAGLRKVADAVIELTEDLDTEAGQAQMNEQLTAVMRRLGLG